jgi:hypothetical protein
MYPRAGLNDVEKFKFLTPPGFELQLLGRPAPSLRYTDYAISALDRAGWLSDTIGVRDYTVRLFNCTSLIQRHSKNRPGYLLHETNVHYDEVTQSC